MSSLIRNVIFIASTLALALGAVRAAPEVMHDAGIVAPQAWGQR